MPDYISAKEAAEKWNISQRRVATLCSQQRVDGAAIVGNMWIIPSNAKKPPDKRSARYRQRKKTLKPFVKWVGGKGQLVDEIMEILPAREEKILNKYAEPMVGGGALFFRLLSDYDFEELYIGDSNPELINAYIAIKKNVEQLIEKLSCMQSNYLPLDDNGRKFYYYDVRDKFNGISLSEKTSVEKAAYFIFLNKTCFNGLYRVNKKGQFNVPMGSYKNPAICDGENLRNVHAALQNVKIVCGDYTKASSFIDDKTLVYFDPPYRPISETSAFTSYNSTAFDDSEQIRLAQFVGKINALGAKILVSNSEPKNFNPDDEFFEDLYRGYTIRRVSATRMVNSNAGGRGKINELLICNW